MVDSQTCNFELDCPDEIIIGEGKKGGERVREIMLEAHEFQIALDRGSKYIISDENFGVTTANS